MLQVVRASVADADALFALQKLAFERIAIRANLPAIPPMAETVADLRQDFAVSTILKALWQEERVGAVRGTPRANVCHVRRMAVHPEHQGKGMGSALLAEIEQSFSGVAAFELFSHSQKRRGACLVQALRLSRHSSGNDSWVRTHGIRGKDRQCRPLTRRSTRTSGVRHIASTRAAGWSSRQAS